MSDQRRTNIDGATLLDVVPALRLLRTVPMAVQPSCLAIGLLVVTALVTAGRLWDAAVTPAVAPAGLLAGLATPADREAAAVVRHRILERYGIGTDGVSSMSEAAEQLRVTVRSRLAGLAEPEQDAEWGRLRQALLELDAARPLGTFEAAVGHTSDAFDRTLVGVLRLQPAEVIAGAADLVVRGPIALWRWHRAFLVVFSLLVVALAALGGGTLVRLAACRWAAAPDRRLRDHLDFAARRFGSSAAALLLPLLMAALASIVILLIGLLWRLPVLDVIGGLLYGPALLVGIVLALLLTGYVAAVALLVPAVICETGDAADAQQRAFAYVLNRPLHLLGYALIWLAGLAVGYLVVSLIIVLALDLTAALAGLAGGPHPATSVTGGFALFDLTPRPLVDVAGGTAGWTVALVRFWQMVLVNLAPAYAVAYLFTGATGIYLLLRQACDGQAIEEIAASGSKR